MTLRTVPEQRLTALSTHVLERQPHLDADSVDAAVRATVATVFDRLLERSEHWRSKMLESGIDGEDAPARALEARRCASVPFELLEG